MCFNFLFKWMLYSIQTAKLEKKDEHENLFPKNIFH